MSLKKAKEKIGKKAEYSVGFGTTTKMIDIVKSVWEHNKMIFVSFEQSPNVVNFDICKFIEEEVVSDEALKVIEGMLDENKKQSTTNNDPI